MSTSVYLAEAGERVDSFIARMSAEEEDALSRSAAAKLCDEGKVTVAGKAVKTAKVVILGLTFKENCPDTRNSKVEDIIVRLREYGVTPVVVDPWASREDAMREYGVTLSTMDEAKNADCVIVAVAHNEFKAMSLEEIGALYGDMPNEEKVLIDVKGLYPIKDVKQFGFAHWRL